MVESLWLSSNWRANYEHASIRTFVGVDPEDLVIPPYCEPRSMHPSLSLLHTHLFVICLLVILFLCGLQTL